MTTKHEEAFSRMVVTIRGETIDLTTFKLRIDDVDDGMVNIAADVAWASALYASAQSEADELDAVYRHWRANFGKKLAMASEKAAQWKIEQDIEASAEFLAAKTTCASALRTALLLKGLVDALKAKASSLQTKGGYMRAMLEAEGAGISGPGQRFRTSTSRVTVRDDIRDDGDREEPEEPVVEPPKPALRGKEAADALRASRIGSGRRRGKEGLAPEANPAD